MSEYTPTTEEIRRNNWLGTALRSSDGLKENAAFNRWLAQHTKQVVEDTEQRIIELLEAKREKHIPWCGTAYCIECEQTIGIEKAIALIKVEGENKQPTDTLCQQGIHSWTFGREVCLSCGIKGENK